MGRAIDPIIAANPYGVQAVDIKSFPGIDSSGSVQFDNAPGFQNALNILSVLGLSLLISAGTYNFKTQVFPPSGSNVIQEEAATIQANLPGTTIANGTLFYAPVPGIASATTLNATPTPGLDTYTVSTAADLTPLTWIQI